MECFNSPIPGVAPISLTSPATKSGSCITPGRSSRLPLLPISPARPAAWGASAPIARIAIDTAAQLGEFQQHDLAVGHRHIQPIATNLFILVGAHIEGERLDRKG